ncbi:MAG: hypothetical protein LQ337_003374 [Flavoplaca oasis]|nr:MAG: hypothetical protein LQ337_003374 [Flavoplaca oasis]
MPFPILDLPLEIRKMIYREIVLSLRDQTGMARLYHAYGALLLQKPKIENPKHKLRRKDAMNLMLTNTQTRIEASQVLMEERFLRSIIRWGCFAHNIVDVANDEIPLYRLHPNELLSTIQSLEIVVPNAWYFYDAKDRVPWAQLDNSFEYGLARTLSVLCCTLASQGLGLKKILVYIPCYCSSDNIYAKDDRENRIYKERCFPADGLARILEPIRKLRASRIRFVHQCTSPHIAELQGVFQDLTDAVQSSTTGTAVSKDETVWCNLWQEAQRRKPFSYTIERHLDEAWNYMNGCLTELDWPVVGPEMYPQKCRYHLEEARQDLERRFWDEELMSEVAVLSDRHERRTICMSGSWDEYSMSNVATFLS